MVNLLAAHTTACFSIGCLDRTPSRYDSDWATLLLTLTNGTDSRICQFDAAGNAPRTSRQLCFLPADAEFAARADTRAYLKALTTNSLTDITSATLNPASPFNPLVNCIKPVGSTCQARPLPVSTTWLPFYLLTDQNMCMKTSIRSSSRVACPPDSNLMNAVATSIFKMSKWYPGKYSVNKWIPHYWNVVPQPCQPGLIQIGADVETNLAICNCCPTPLPQTFSYVAPAVAAAVVTPASVITEAGPAATAATATPGVTPIDPAVVAATADVEFPVPVEPAAAAAAVQSAAPVEPAAAEGPAVVAATAVVEVVEPAAVAEASAVTPAVEPVAAAVVEHVAANMVQGRVLPAEALTLKSKNARAWAAFADANPFNPVNAPSL